VEEVVHVAAKLAPRHLAALERAVVAQGATSASLHRRSTALVQLESRLPVLLASRSQMVVGCALATR
jgi:hypothetical protein